MSTLNANAQTPTPEAVKTKRVRKVIPKVTKTGVEIEKEILEITAQLNDLEKGLAEVAQDSVVHSIVQAAFEAKSKELEQVRATVYTI
jgi:hypothetical protein